VDGSFAERDRARELPWQHVHVRPVGVEQRAQLLRFGSREPVAIVAQAERRQEAEVVLPLRDDLLLSVFVLDDPRSELWRVAVVAHDARELERGDDDAVGVPVEVVLLVDVEVDVEHERVQAAELPDGEEVVTAGGAQAFITSSASSCSNSVSFNPRPRSTGGERTGG
jgi:hypothetical protein